MLTGSCLCGTCRWTFRGDPGSATACNCTACRRYGTLWIYGWEGHEIDTTGPLTDFIRGKALAFRFCARCGCMVAWRGLMPQTDGRTRIAVNLRLCDDPEAVAHLPIDHFDGLNSFDDLPRDDRTVRHMWF